MKEKLKNFKFCNIINDRFKLINQQKEYIYNYERIIYIKKYKENSENNLKNLLKKKRKKRNIIILKLYQ